MIETNSKDTSTPLKYKSIQLKELEEMMKEKIALFEPLPEILLVENKIICKRPAGIFNNLSNCIVIHTKDQYLHVFDNEDKDIPVFSLDLKKTEARNNDTTLELLEKKSVVSIMEKLNIRMSHKIAFESKETAKEWAERINAID